MPNVLSAGGCLLGLMMLATPFASSFAATPMAAAADLRGLSLQELMNLEVTTVSRRPERLVTAPSAIQVITGEDIRRSGATSLPGALRLASNLHVARVNASQWAISARGFNNVLANKLLVMIDGRTVYTPLYSGVFWDVQDVLLEDIDRIEVVSGPGGTLWGANAVNGVINVTTKPAGDTQGLYARGGLGDELSGYGAVRYGGEFGDGIRFRGYAKAFEADDTLQLDGRDAGDGWGRTQAGIRVDWERSGDRYTLQSDIYDADPNPDGLLAVDTQGGNISARWERTTASSANLQLQAYVDRTERDFGNGLAESLTTWDVDWQHILPRAGRHELTWGLGARYMEHDVDNLPLFRFMPATETLELYSAFVQDRIELLPKRLHLTIGSKFEHNHYTGFELQPGANLAWSPTSRMTWWASVSRAVRTPSRVDRDLSLLIAPDFPLIQGSNVDSEKLLAWELGWRSQLNADLALSAAAFYNDYDDIRSAEPGTGPFNLPVVLGNGVHGESYGLELSAVWQATSAWRLRGGYTWFDKSLRLSPGSRDLNNATAESDDPAHQVLIQSTLTLAERFELDAVARYVDRLPVNDVPSYLSLDVRVGYRWTDTLELSLVGRDLLDGRHQEFVPASPSPRLIERSVYGQLTWRP